MYCAAFLGALAKLREAAISFEISVRPSVFMKKTQLPLDGFLLNLIFEYFSKICRENLRFIKI